MTSSAVPLYSWPNMADLSWSCGGEFLAVVCSDGVKVLVGRDGTCKFSHTVNSEQKQPQALQDDTGTLGHGVLCCFSNSGNLFALCTPQKELFIWQTSDWKLKNKREVIRRTTVMLFSNKEDYIITSNKGGEVYRFSICDPDQEKELLLGHVSMILDMVLTRDDKYLITCDRDEKIRVSCYPNSYNIHSFCLGNLDFVSSLALLQATGQSILVSGGGDGFVRFWNPESGKQITSKVIDALTESSNEEDQKSIEGLPLTLSLPYPFIHICGERHYEREEEMSCNPIISCLACCHKNSVVCVVIERCRTIYFYHISQNEVTTLPSLESSVPPWSAVFDPEGRLWCVQPYPEEPVVVFEPSGDSTSNLTYAKLSSDFSPLLSSASDWNFLKGSLNQERKLDALRKKEVDNITDYLARKEERKEKKKNKNKEENNGHTAIEESIGEQTAESEAKRPRLAVTS